MTHIGKIVSNRVPSSLILAFFVDTEIVKTFSPSHETVDIKLKKKSLLWLNSRYIIYLWH